MEQLIMAIMGTRNCKIQIKILAANIALQVGKQEKQ